MVFAKLNKAHSQMRPPSPPGGHNRGFTVFIITYHQPVKKISSSADSKASATLSKYDSPSTNLPMNQFWLLYICKTVSSEVT